MSDAKSNAADYAARKATGREPVTDPGDGQSAPAMNARNRAAFIENSIQQAIRRGDFDDLPGAGKPLRNLGAGRDPDWWIRQKIESENLTGLGPPALRLRVENAELDALLDRETNEARIREILDDFNRRVIEARRQLLGGPPVITPTRDIDAEVLLWQERREIRREAAKRASEAAAVAAPPRRRWWGRRSQRG